MDISHRLATLAPSATLAVNARAMELRAQGVPLISLAIGEPDFPTPAHICQAGKDAIDAGFTRYTNAAGIPELREAAAQYFNTHCYAKAKAENICITNGGKQSLYNIFQSLLNAGDEVLIPVPYWVSYPPLVSLADGVPVCMPTTAEQSFKISVADLDKYKTPQTKALLFNSPSNPSGMCYTKAETDAIAQWAVDNDVFFISDEIYDNFVFGSAEFVSLCSWWNKYPDKFAVVNCVSKSFAMTGWRVGYTLAHPALIKAMAKLSGQAVSNVCSISQKAALAALNGSMDCVKEMSAVFEKRKNKAVALIKEWKNCYCPDPQGAFYLFVDVHKLYTTAVPDSVAFCEHMLNTAQVAMVPGVAFGDDNCVRLSYALNDEDLEKALKAIKVCIEKDF